MSEKHLSNDQLKYFYLIDTDTVISNILKSDTYTVFTEDDNPTPLFHLIFKEIYHAAECYTSYILNDYYYSHPSFFNEEPGNTSAQNAFLLCGLSLFHHCIIHGFQTSLDHSTEEPTGAASIVHLSAATEAKIKLGYFRCPDKTNKSPIHVEPADSTSHQNYNNQYHRFFNPKSNIPYSEILLHHMNCRDEDKDKSKNKNQLWIKNYQSNAAYFLFSSGDVKNFNTVLHKSDMDNKKRINFIDRYSVLHQAVAKHHSGLLIPDQVLFDMTLESAYHFSLSSYVYKLFSEFHNPESSSPIKCLRGETFNNILSDYVFQLPITYNRSIFLKYACMALLGNHTLKPSYPPDPLKSFGTYDSSAPIASDLFAIEALKNIGYFFRMLNYITIPILESFWDVVTTALNAEHSITLEHYQKYIEANYKIMSMDYTTLPDILTKDLNRIPTYQDIVSIVASIEERFPTSSPAYYHDQKRRYPPAVLYEFCPFLQKQCVLRSQLPASTVLDRLYISTPTSDCEANYNLEVDAFKRKHTQNLFQFIQMLDRESVLPEKK